MPDGARRLRLVVTDAAGNARTVDAGTVEVANQPRVDTPPGPGTPPRRRRRRHRRPRGPRAPPAPAPAAPPRPAGRSRRTRSPGAATSPNGRNASEHAWLDAWLEPRRTRSGAPLRRASTTVPYGVRVRIRGRLTDERGRPIARAALAAVRREPGRPWRAVTGVRTRPDGRFTAFTRVGPSQELRFVYYAYGDSPRGQRSRRLRVRVRRGEPGAAGAGGAARGGRLAWSRRGAGHAAGIYGGGSRDDAASRWPCCKSPLDAGRPPPPYPAAVDVGRRRQRGHRRREAPGPLEWTP